MQNRLISGFKVSAMYRKGFWVYGLVAMMCVWASVGLHAQVKIEVVKHPKFLTSDSSLYLSATLNNWSPGTEQYKLKRASNGVYSIELPDTLTYFQYKFTQGTWSLVEGTAEGQVMANRVYDRRSGKDSLTVQVEIQGWETQPMYTLIVESLPPNTPVDASLYVMGNFNNWNPADPGYKLIKQKDGTWRTLIYMTRDLEYKFTRGTEESVECASGGKPIPFRVTSRHDVQYNSEVRASIAAWRDIQDRSPWYSIFDILMLFSVFQGILLLISLSGIQNNNREANRWLHALIGFSTFILLAKVLAGMPWEGKFSYKLLLLPDFIFFIYAPLFYFYIDRLLFQIRLHTINIRVQFIPALVQLCIYLVYFLMDDNTLERKFFDPNSELNVLRTVLTSVALLFNFIYWTASYKAVWQYKENYSNSHSYEQNLLFLNAVLWVQGIGLFSWLCIGLLKILSISWLGEVQMFVQLGSDSIWILFSSITYFLGYFVIQQPDVLRMNIKNATMQVFKETAPDTASMPSHGELFIPVNHEKHAEPEVNLSEGMEKLEAYMKQHKPYTNSKLTLVDLATGLNMPPYLVSKIINTSYNKNFFDFINTYRINEFKSRVESQKYKHLTLLGLAFDVGFNSKTAFNRSFKKMTNETPSEYYGKHKEFETTERN